MLTKLVELLMVCPFLPV